MPTISTQLVLASSSPYRRQLMERLGIDFTVIAPAVDETPLAQESPAELALRLAREKASAVAADYPDAVIVGSDQVASIDEEQLGKPGNHKVAAAQLARCSGRAVKFHTAVCVCHRASGAGEMTGEMTEGMIKETHVDLTTVHFHTLNSAMIDSYLRKDQPWDCAGSFKSEGLGVTLFDAIETRDPTAIIGLPLIWLAGSLQRAGITLLD
jgi:7-methyl-GTP pyrophosphatase